MFRAASLFNILREIDLGRIRAASEQRFSLLVSGEHDLGVRLAKTLSQGETPEDFSPWITHCALAEAPQHTGHDLALLVTVEGKPDRAARETLRRLAPSGPVIQVVAGSSPAQLPPGLEAARVHLAALSPTEVQRHLAPEVLRLLPEALHLPLARRLPLFRPAAMRALVEETARANAFYAASTGLAATVPILNLPLNAADFLILTKNQLVMAYKLALAAGKTGRPQDIMGEVIGVLGGGLLFRQLARSLVGLIPVAGIIPSVAISYAGTEAIGHAVTLWAYQGEHPSTQTIKQFYREALGKGNEVAKVLVARVRRDRGRTPQLPPAKQRLEPSSKQHREP
jgi:uncharacterized protein (DUF697 family)